MRKFLNRKSLFIFDGLIFFLVGIVVLIFPSASASSIPPEAGSLPHIEDTRRLLAAMYIPLGMFLLMFGSRVVNAATRNLAANLRGVSLFILFGVNLWQEFNGFWKPASLYIYLVLFPVMAIAYFYFGTIKPELEPSRD